MSAFLTENPHVAGNVRRFSHGIFCYAYGRLSKEDLDKKAESDSIKNQRDLIHAYIDRDPELHLVMEGYDDGYTGTSFDRPHVREMLEAVKSGKVNCVVVKDLSRFGRDYIEPGSISNDISRKRKFGLLPLPIT